MTQIDLEYQAWHEYAVFLLLAEQTMNLCFASGVMAPALTRLFVPLGFSLPYELGRVVLHLHALQLQKESP